MPKRIFRQVLVAPRGTAETLRAVPDAQPAPADDALRAADVAAPRG
jgi:hypothetical protein